MTKKIRCTACWKMNPPHTICECRIEQPSKAALNGHIRYRDKPKESRVDLDTTRNKFKIYAHNTYLFEHYDKKKAINQAQALGYFESSINFVMIKPTKTK